jgi:hypothetical protein
MYTCGCFFICTEGKMSKERSYYPPSNYQQGFRRKKRFYHPKPYQNHQQPRPNGGGMFNQNLANNMRFGGKDHDLSAYVSRKLIVIDKFGNKKIAEEKQFFNSGKRITRIKIDNNEGDG